MLNLVQNVKKRGKVRLKLPQKGRSLNEGGLKIKSGYDSKRKCIKLFSCHAIAKKQTIGKLTQCKSSYDGVDFKFVEQIGTKYGIVADITSRRLTVANIAKCVSGIVRKLNKISEARIGVRLLFIFFDVRTGLKGWVR